MLPANSWKQDGSLFVNKLQNPKAQDHLFQNLHFKDEKPQA